MASTQERLLLAIAQLETQRERLGADVVDLALAPLREKLAREQGGDAEPDAQQMQQLRQVSVLFCDVVGSTALSQHLSPEDIHAVMDRALAGITRVVNGHHGTVLQYAGDSLLAVWGAPVAHEGDAAAAVNAALAALQEAQAHAAAVQQRHGLGGFGVRAGIATGPVLLGGGVDGERSIRGMTVNIAARMEQTAPPGTLRVCADTWRLVRGQFDGSPQPPLQIKGRDESMSTWLVHGALADAPLHAERGVAGVATPCVGRSAELAALQQAGSAGGGLRTVVVVAEPGIGKSRLAREFRLRAAQQPAGQRCLEAGAAERDAGRPYGLLRQLFARHAGIRDSDSTALARAHWLQALTPLLRSQGDAAVLGQLLGLDFAAHTEVQPLLKEAQQLRDRAFFHAAQALRALAASGPPLLVLLDDLHWADPGTLDFIELLQARHADIPLMLLALARPEVALLRPAWRSALGPCWIDLQPLRDDDAATLADALLARLPAAAAEALRERLTATAAGNPFFLEEMVNMLIDRGDIRVNSGNEGVHGMDGMDGAGGTDGTDRTRDLWQISRTDLAGLPLPRTLTGVLQARLDRLSPAEARVLQGAAVVGVVFWDDALQALGLQADAALLRLVSRQFVLPRATSQLEGRREYSFRHHLLQRVCYERLLQRERVPAHAQVAHWLEGLPGDKPQEQIAEHFERGAEPARALAAWQRAAEQAQARYANEQALAHAARALALLAPDAQPRTQPHTLSQKYALTLLRTQVFALVGQNAARVAELDALEALAEALDDDHRRCEVLDARAKWHFEAGDAQQALALAQRAEALAPADAPQLAASAGRHRAHALSRLGRHEEFRHCADELLGLARRLQDKGLEGAMLNALGLHADDRGDPAAAIGFYEQALHCHRATGNQTHEGDVLNNLGYVELGLGAYEQAAERFEEVLARYQRIGRREGAATVQLNLALAAMHSGKLVHALGLARQALPVFDAVGSHWLAAAARRIAGQAELAMGEHAAALVSLQTARDGFASLGLAQLAAEASASLALAQQASGHREQARASVDAVLALLDATAQSGEPALLDGVEEPLRVYADCWQVLHAQGDPRAGRCLQAGRRLLQERAARVADPARRDTLLHRVPHHRLLRQAEP